MLFRIRWISSLHHSSVAAEQCSGVVCHAPWAAWAGCWSPCRGPWARRRINHWILWRITVQRQTYGYLPSLRASPALDRYQIYCLVTEACVWTTCVSVLHESASPRVELATVDSQVQRPIHCTTRPRSAERSLYSTSTQFVWRAGLVLYWRVVVWPPQCRSSDISPQSLSPSHT